MSMQSEVYQQYNVFFFGIIECMHNITVIMAHSQQYCQHFVCKCLEGRYSCYYANTDLCDMCMISVGIYQTA